MKYQEAYQKITKFLGSKTFFWIIIGFFVLESLWIAFSFRYPMIYDEKFHVFLTQIFSHQLSPFIINQPHNYDSLRDLTHEALYLYHYILSFPLRFFELFTKSEAAQVVFLRSLNVFMVAGGLFIFGKLFQKVGIRRVYINIALLLFILLPIVPFVAATVNYDNMLFLLTATYLLFSVRIIKSSKILWYDYASLISIGCLASIVKFTFLPIFAASILYLLVFVLRKHSKKFFSKLFDSAKKASIKGLIPMSVLLLLSVGLFSSIYIQNVIRYHTPHPSCTQTMEKQRCLASGIVKRNLAAKTTKDQRIQDPLPTYSLAWFKNMTLVTNWSGNTTTDRPDTVTIKSPLPVMYNLVFFGFLVSCGILLYAWRALRKNASWYFLFTITISLALAVFLNNYFIYRSLHEIYAVQPRYLLSMMPVFLVMVVVASGYIMRKYQWFKVAGLAIIILLFTQGGGAITHILRSDDSWYWQNSKVIKANHAAKKVLSPLVKGDQ